MSNEDGVYLVDNTGTTIGGAGGLLNVISGNNSRGVKLSNSDGNIISSNYVGLDAAGSAIVANGSQGIWLSDSANNQIGDPSAGVGNVITATPGECLSSAPTVPGMWLPVTSSAWTRPGRWRRALEAPYKVFHW